MNIKRSFSKAKSSELKAQRVGGPSPSHDPPTLAPAYQVFDLMLCAGLESHSWQLIPKVIQPLLYNLFGDQVWGK